MERAHELVRSKRNSRSFQEKFLQEIALFFLQKHMRLNGFDEETDVHSLLQASELQVPESFPSKEVLFTVRDSRSALVNWAPLVLEPDSTPAHSVQVTRFEASQKTRLETTSSHDLSPSVRRMTGIAMSSGDGVFART